MAEEDRLVDELARATGKKKGKQVLGAQPGVTRQIGTIGEQAATQGLGTSLGVPASQIAQDFESIEARATARADTTKEPLGSQFVGPVQEPAQRTADRGPETQTTRLGAFDSAGNELRVRANERNQGGRGTQGAALGDASGTGVGTSGTGQRNPFQQLAALRSLRQQPTGGGGVAVAPNSRTRERNARLNDPFRRLSNQLDRDVRLGRISARAARGIQQRNVAAAGSQQIGRDKVAADVAANKALDDFRRTKLASDTELAERKISSDEQQSRADRQADILGNTLSARTDSAKLDETIRKRLQQESQFQRTQGLKLGEAQQRSNLKAAELLQQAQIAGDKNEVARLGEAAGLLQQLNEGGDPTAIVPVIRQLLGDEKAAQIFPQYVIQQ